MSNLHRLTSIPLSFETLLKGQLRFMQQQYDVTAICSDKERLEKIGEDEGVKTYPVELTRQITLRKDFNAVIKLYRYFRKEKPFIVHTHTPKAGLIGMLAAYLARVPNRLHTVAGMPLMEASGMKRKILNVTEKLTYRCATHVYPNSKGLYEFIIKNHFCLANKLKIIGAGSSNGIDTQHFSPAYFSSNERNKLKKRFNIQLNSFIFCFVGRLVKDKGINELVQSFMEVNEQYPQTKLLLVGPFERELDPLFPETEKAIQENPNIISVGFQTDVRPFLAISDIFVFPSYREGFPNVVMQAGAMDLPSIVTDINGCNEIIEEGVNGLIIPSKNKEQLKEKMMLLIEDKDLRNHLKQHAREMITSRYEQKMVWDALLEEYRRLETQNHT
ncbi:N N'-diacetylbacillosaminyl-diphospho-undecaprenol alpha-1 3-N-acetylgalactosaminyltransferase [termite gut metagenome]|uniref:N N'-diacetylbacillosaminyl-diphospho-undecaprenol alpha-1 3-N-acetylgalactosaminyltransferase n=1 Tax=termite gut metagenome TaxID=433724 RepID=A0A5J4S547_9ZZZZ